MEGYINENRWVDLSGLPRSKWGIAWKDSVGYEVPFNYDNIKGYIKIERCEVRTNQTPILYITIDKYIPTPHKIHTSQLLYCQIHRLVTNRIADMAPYLMPYLKNPNDAYLYSCQSNKRIWVKCPVCGHEDLITICHLYLEGKQCSICGDGISYPEKFMRCVLDQLNVRYVKQANKSTPGFEWAMLYRYDFAFRLNNNKFIIETDGGFHKHQTDVDIKKDKLAKDNGFDVIRINCDYQHNDRYQFIKTHIINSPLKDIFNLEKVDWDLCHTSAANTIVKEVCVLWEDGLSSKEICYKLGLSTSTVWKYLKYGKEIGLCPTYDEKISHQRGVIKGDNHKYGLTNAQKTYLKSITKPICLLYENQMVEIFASGKEAELKLPIITGRTYTRKSISRICCGKRGMANGFNMEYITREEYEQYKMINNEVVKDGDRIDIRK
jgi:hypothetical protein